MSSFQEINGLTHNQATTFEFSNDDAQRILMPNIGMDICMSSDHLKKNLEKLHLKMTRQQMHGSTLSEYWKNKRIPQGLRLQKAPTIGKNNPAFVQKWSEILNKCSLDLMLLIIDHVKADCSEIEKEIKTQELTLKEQFDADFAPIEQSIKETVRHLKEKLLATKLRKYKRDTEDYIRKQVYIWDKAEDDASQGNSAGSQQPPPAPRTNQRGPQQPNSATYYRREAMQSDSDFTLDSDSSQHSREQPFLGQRRRYNGRKRNAGGGRDHTQTGQRPLTRSQKTR